MPIIYLSPSTQEYNEYVNGLGNEEEWMNRLADAMEPMLFASGIQYTRNTPDMTAASSIRASNAGNYNLNLVRTEPTTTIGEVRRVRAPAVLLELGFHDNPDDAQWIVTHIDAMAESIVLSLTEYFGIPFFPDSYPLPGEVRAELGALDVYSRPDFDTPPIAQLYDGAQVTVINEYYGWYLIQFGDQVGYVAADFVAVE